jgi:hypothetical protein
MMAKAVFVGSPIDPKFLLYAAEVLVVVVIIVLAYFVLRKR